MRLFIGIPLAEKVVAELSSLCARLRSNSDSLRWSTPESWHITLQFLGNASQEQYGCLTAQLGAVQSPSFSIRLGSLGLFDRAGVFYADVEPNPQLIALQQRVIAATAPCGFAAESRPYHPHITLARAKAKGRSSLSALKHRVPPQPRFSTFSAREFLLYESHLSSEGSTYEIRARFPLHERR